MGCCGTGRDGALLFSLNCSWSYTLLGKLIFIRLETVENKAAINTVHSKILPVGPFDNQALKQREHLFVVHQERGDIQFSIPLVKNELMLYLTTKLSSKGSIYSLFSKRLENWKYRTVLSSVRLWAKGIRRQTVIDDGFDMFVQELHPELDLERVSVFSKRLHRVHESLVISEQLFSPGLP